jgi:hypothetical protein
MLAARPIEISTQVHFCGENAIAIAGQTLVPDSSKAYVEFRISHAFPVVTTDKTALHPNVVAKSFESMRHQVFNLGHLMKAYNSEEITRDRILGSVVAVEFPNTPLGGWKVQTDRTKAPGIRGVAVLHKNAEGADRILGTYQSGRRRWTVSMENEYTLEGSGFLLKKTNQTASKLSAKDTPDDLAQLGYTYVPAISAPDALLDCYDTKQSKVTKNYAGHEVTALIGGLDSTIHYKGVGLTPLGKEPEAEVAQMLASGASIADMEDSLAWQIIEALKNSLKLTDCYLSEIRKTA